MTELNADILRDSVITMNKPTKNTVEYKTLCLVLYICTGSDFYYKEGTTNIKQMENEEE